VLETPVSHDPLIDLLRRRTWAGWIDVLILFVVGVIVSAVTGNAHIGSWTTSEYGSVVHHSGVVINLPTGPFLLWVAVAVLYYSVDELLTGQTIGKRLMGLKVIMVNGRPLDGRPVILRTVCRIIDVLPVFYLVGWIAMRGPHRPPQRLGDRLAGTTVVPVSHP
jgi:uncharacterized RDD family membrane protein YckC